MATIEPIVTSIYRIAVQKGGLAGAGSRVPKLNGLLTVRGGVLSDLLATISRTDAAGARRAATEAKLGAAGAMLVLLVAFAFFYARSHPMRRSSAWPVKRATKRELTP